jgi:hypothetical protein
LFYIRVRRYTVALISLEFSTMGLITMSWRLLSAPYQDFAALFTRRINRPCCPTKAIPTCAVPTCAVPT